MKILPVLVQALKENENMSETKSIILVDNPNEAVMLIGIGDANLKLIEHTFNVSVITRGESIQIVGENVDNKELAKQVFEALLKVIRKNINIDSRDVATAIEMAQKGTIEYLSELYDEEIARTAKGKAIRAKIGRAHV